MSPVSSGRDADLGLIRTLRSTAVAFHRSRVAVLKVGGEAAWDLLDRVLPCELYLREGQLLPTLLLHDDGTIAADLTVGADAEDFWLLVEGMTAEEVLARLDEAREPDEDIVLIDLSEQLSAVGVEGPYAWRALEAAGHTGASRLPFLSFQELEGGLWTGRTGRSGEYGYLLLVPTSEVSETLASLDGLLLAGPAELAHCTVEAFGFDVHHPLCTGLDPLSLQLQWRLCRQKGHVRGMEALAARRRLPEAQRQRTVGLRGPAGMSPGEVLLLDGEAAGRVLSAVPWLGPGGGSIGVGLLPLPCAHPGLDALSVATGPVRSVSPPFFLARSFRLKPSPRAPEPDTLPPPYT